MTGWGGAAVTQKTPWFEFYPFLILLSENRFVGGPSCTPGKAKCPVGSQLFLFSLNGCSKLPGPTGSWGVRRLGGLSFEAGFELYPAS